MRLRFTHHAWQRMALRSITEDDIRNAFEIPHEVIPGKGDSLRLSAKAGAKKICVIYRETPDEEVLVVTVWPIE